MKKIFILLTISAAVFSFAAEVKLTDFKNLSEAEKLSWHPRSTAELSVPQAGVLRAQGKDAKRFCGMELRKLPALDYSGAIKCKVKMNFGKHVYFVLSTSEGYFDIFLPITPGTSQVLTIPLDIKKWRCRGSKKTPATFGNVAFFAVMHPAMQKSSEFIEISDLTFPVKSELKSQKFALPADAVKLSGNTAEYSFSPVNGSLLAVKNKRNGNFAVQGVENHYFLQSVSGDAETFEHLDKVVSKKISKDKIHFVCTNARLDGITIEKTYCIESDRLRRKMTFKSSRRQDTAFITPRTRVRFSNEFYNNGFYLGSGYIGPLMEVPKLNSPQQERSFLQTTKGMLLYHDGDQGSFTQYRTHLNGKFVFPWWQSAIVTYQEKANALFYQPDGWEMALGTIDVLPGKSFTIDDTFAFFNGNWHTFLNDIYPNDPVVSKVLKSFKPGASWLADVKVQLSAANISEYQKLALLLDEGEIIAMIGSTGSWGDYHFDTPKAGFHGGSINKAELQELAKDIKNISPNYRLGIYNWISSAMVNSDVVKKHPDFFMFKNRNMQEKNLFPGLYRINYPVMMNRPAAAEFMLDNFRSLVDTFNFDFIYLDETKTISLIDWQKNDLMRDDHWADFWMGMHRLGQEKNIVMFGNGRGNPYHELNYIEARHQLAPSFWRKFCGMAMAVATFVNQRPGARVDLLYWNPKMDYITRVLANGFIPTINFLRYQQIPYITANYELGKSTIYDLKYTPDWKYDSATELESYAIRRDSGKEIILSLINRSHKNSVEVKVNTGDLPEQLTVWAYRVNKYIDEPAKYGFGEKERRSNYKTAQWREGVITRPELLFMGKNPGKLALKLDNFAKDEFVQIVFSNAAAGTYSVNDLPCNYFLTDHRQLKVKSSGVVTEVSSNADTAEVIIFQAPGNYLLNGRKVLAKPVRFGKKIYSVLSVPKGKTEIRKVDDAEYASEKFSTGYTNGQLTCTGSGYLCIYDKNNVLLYCGNAPKLPEYHDAGILTITSLDGKYSQKLKINTGKSSPAMLVQEPPLQGAKHKLNSYPTPIQRDGALIIGSAEYTSRWRNFSGMQKQLAPLVSNVDDKNLTLTAGTTRRVQDFSGVAAAGFLLDKVQKAEIELTHTFTSGGGLSDKHTHRYKKNRGEFSGIMLDYETGKNKYVRKALSIGVLHFANPQPGNHAYGALKAASEIYLAGDWVNESDAKTFTLDLLKLAPKNWTGRVYVSAATGFIVPDRRVTLKFKRFNNAIQAPEIKLVNLADFLKQTQVPRKIQITQQSGSLDYNTVIKNPLPETFYKLGLDGFSDAVKVAAVSGNKEYICAALEVAMPQNVNQLEFWLVGSNKKVWQFSAYSDNSSMITCNLQPFVDKQVKISVGGQKKFFFAIPRTLLGNGNEFRFNLALYRHGSSTAPGAFATYAALKKSFYDPENFAYGKIIGSADNVTTEQKYTVYNLGKGGYTTGNIIHAKLPEVLKLKPQAVVLLAGTNDMLNTGKLATHEQFEKNLRYIIKTLQKNGAKVVMNTLPPCSEKLLLQRHKPEKFGNTSPMERIAQANRIVRKIAAECNCELIDLYDLVISSGDPDSRKSLLRNPANEKSRDGVHLRAAGYRLWAEKLSSSATLKQLPAHSSIVCLGDSLTWGASMKGAGTVEGETMPAFLNKSLNKGF